MANIELFLEKLVGILWSTPLALFLISAGVFFTLYFRCVQFRLFKHAIDIARGKFDSPEDPGEISHFRALCAALSGTVGLGNIAGVAVAIHLGGPGATVWMIIAGLLGMATKFTECTLAVKYRNINAQGEVRGGPMYYMSQALPKPLRPVASFFAIFCILGSFGGANMFQTNQVAAIFDSSFGVPPLATGLLLGVLTAVVIIGGIKRIGLVAGTLVPVMGMSYVLACLGVILVHFDRIPEMFVLIFSSALHGTAAVGGFAGATLKEVMVLGMKRASFSNEAGLGTSAIAHSVAKTKQPVREGIVALLEPFIDTVVICTMTALAINFSGLWNSDLTGVALTAAALNESVPGLGTYFIPVAVALFAYSTLLSWSYYGERATDYLLGSWAILPYKILFCIVAVLGAVWSLNPVINLSDSAIALMAIPNVLALLVLAPVVRRELLEYERQLPSKSKA